MDRVQHGSTLIICVPMQWTGFNRVQVREHQYHCNTIAMYEITKYLKFVRFTACFITYDLYQFINHFINSKNQLLKYSCSSSVSSTDLCYFLVMPLNN